MAAFVRIASGVGGEAAVNRFSVYDSLRPEADIGNYLSWARFSHARAICLAAAICAEVIFWAKLWNHRRALTEPCAAVRLYHMWARTKRRGSRPLTHAVIAGGVGLSLLFANPLAIADGERALSRTPSHFAAVTGNSGASTFVPNRRLGDAQRIRPRTQLGRSRDQHDQLRLRDLEDDTTRDHKFDRDCEGERREWLTSLGYDHRGSPSNGFSPFFPNRVDCLMRR